MLRPVLNQYGTQFVPYFHKCPIHMSVTHTNTKSNNNDQNKTQGILRSAKLSRRDLRKTRSGHLCVCACVWWSRLPSDRHHTPALLTKPAPFKNHPILHHVLKSVNACRSTDVSGKTHILDWTASVEMFTRQVVKYVGECFQWRTVGCLTSDSMQQESNTADTKDHRRPKRQCHSSSYPNHLLRLIRYGTLCCD